MDQIQLSGHHLGVVGILSYERESLQPVHYKLQVNLDLTPSALTGDLRSSVNYAWVQAVLNTLIEFGRFRLLESLALTACRFLLAAPHSCEGRAQINQIQLNLSKPEILDHAVPSICMQRTPEALPVNQADNYRTTTLIELAEVTVQRVVIEEEGCFFNNEGVVFDGAQAHTVAQWFSGPAVLMVITTTSI